MLPFSYAWGGGAYLAPRGPHRGVVLREGQAAWFLVTKYRCDIGVLRTADGISVFPPDGSEPRRLRLPKTVSFDYCRAVRGPNRADPGNTVHIGPIVQTRAGLRS